MADHPKEPKLFFGARLGWKTRGDAVKHLRACAHIWQQNGCHNEAKRVADLADKMEKGEDPISRYHTAGGKPELLKHESS